MYFRILFGNLDNTIFSKGITIALNITNDVPYNVIEFGNELVKYDCKINAKTSSNVRNIDATDGSKS